MFWGVADIAAIKDYGANVEGEWLAVPAMLALFRRYGINATWATVGMVMCRDYAQWHDMRPKVMPAYSDAQLSSYRHADSARQHPKLFFGRTMVEQILATPGQELASHTYSHFLCDEQGATPGQFAADMRCASAIADDVGAKMHSLVLPRNQVHDNYLAVLPENGISVYRGNADHWMFRSGHAVPGGVAGRAARLADAWLPLRRATVQRERRCNGLVNVPASMFLRPWSRRLSQLEPVRMRRLRSAMTDAARADGLFHLWWHPHNFGVNLAENMRMLENVLQHYARLHDEYGMRSMTMRAFEESQGDGRPPHA